VRTNGTIFAIFGISIVVSVAIASTLVSAISRCGRIGRAAIACYYPCIAYASVLVGRATAIRNFCGGC
jgi:hypothetical protein